MIISKEVLSKLDLHVGDNVYLVETKDGYKITPYDPQFESQVQAAQHIMRQYKNALKVLSK